MATLEKDIPIRPFGEQTAERVLAVACSVRLGVALLCVVVVICCIGMVIMQQNVDGFQSYYAALSPAERAVFERLGFFNIYHAWYFKALLSLLSLNIILASIDRFPKSWQYVSKPQIVVPTRWLSEQAGAMEFTVNDSIARYSERVKLGLAESGLRRIRTTEKDGSIYILGESGVWNRLGAYPVHAALLTILFGGFLSSQMSTGGMIELGPGQTSDLISQNVVDLNNINKITRRLPFSIYVTDIEQNLIRRDGALAPENTLDWVTRFNIIDEGEEHEAVVRLNQPFDYRGYRFFQSDFTPVGRARRISVEMNSIGRTEMFSLDRDQTINLSSGVQVEFTGFRADFRPGPEDPKEKTTDYKNPIAILKVTPTDGLSYTAYAGTAIGPSPARSTSGYRFKLIDFERVSDRHILSVQRDPGSGVVYFGFLFLGVTLAAVFFLSHQRIWVVFEETNDGLHVRVASNTNRQPDRLTTRVRRVAKKLQGE